MPIMGLCKICNCQRYTLNDLHELYTFDDLVLVCSLVKGVSSVKHLIEIVHLLQIEINS